MTTIVPIVLGAFVLGGLYGVLDRIAGALCRIADAQETVAGAVCLEHAERTGLLLRVPDAPPEDL